MEQFNKPKIEKQVKCLLLFFIAALLVSGLTAFPIAWELDCAQRILQTYGIDNALSRWLLWVNEGIACTYNNYPFVAYGTDWLAFAHIVLAVLFIGPLRQPVKNIWVVQFGLIACAAIFPTALLAGQVRGIPFYWRLIDCSFGLVGAVVLWLCHYKIKQLEKQQ